MRTAIMILLLAGTLHAQSLPTGSASPFSAARILVGVTGSSEFSNESIGIGVAAEIPIHRFEIDPAIGFGRELHLGLGSGTAWDASIGGIAWINDTFGISTSAQYSGYAVTAVSKAAEYWSIGPIMRRRIFGAPARISVGYVRQGNNGISNGNETSHLSGAHLGLTARMGSTGPVSWRMSESIDFGRVLTQGNPICDGSLPNTMGFAPCPRRSAWSGGASVSVSLEFPRRRGREQDLF